MYGTLYAIPFSLVLVAIIFRIHSNILTYVWSYSLLIGAFTSMIHAFNIRKEFLARLEARHYGISYVDKPLILIHQNESNYGLNTEYPTVFQYDGPVPKTVITKGPLIRQS